MLEKVPMLSANPIQPTESEIGRPVFAQGCPDQALERRMNLFRGGGGKERR